MAGGGSREEGEGWKGGETVPLSGRGWPTNGRRGRGRGKRMPYHYVMLRDVKGLLPVPVQGVGLLKSFLVWLQVFGAAV